MYLEKINSPADLKKLSKNALPALCAEMRQSLLEKLSVHGGHAGPNLGLVELTVAMHYVFASPEDKIVFDVSHQCYAHKMLTGRRVAFTDPDRYDDVNGFTNPKESEHDLFTVGHTSTALSLACGLAKARDLRGEKHNVVAIVGDGSLSGGEAYEALNNVAEQNTNTIIVVNDNEMSIAENHGGYAKNLELLRKTSGNAPHNMFKALGLDYVYEEQGNDVLAMVAAFEKVKDSARPVVLHVHTQKGKGFWAAEQNRETFHSGGPFSLETGKYLVSNSGETYNEITYGYLKEKMAADPTVVAISSATPVIIGMTPERRKEAGKRFVDVGICEEHAVAYAAGIARGGAKPVYAVFGSFIQRSFDQLHQDLALDNNPATILVFWDSVYGMGGATHNGLYDIAELSNIPNLVYLAPTCAEEYLAMLDWSVEQTDLSVAIRVPFFVTHGKASGADYSRINKSKVICNGRDVAIFAVGSFMELGKKVVDRLAEHGIKATLIDPVYLSGLDAELLRDLAGTHNLAVTLEEGIVEGGYGQKIASFYGDTDVKVKNFGLEKSFFGDFAPDELLRDNGLTAENITDYVLETLRKSK
ncbi:MAG: 1-deoxy-D-xylulose-5-phosphate synthase [Corallococcus sp.]|nr:1-deoxy-D-xylulose-5-phosphate synthase [Corallococcus sp.]MCM1358922.1 1-deoxy-D-xylulose-5-phosphate synthase [Corallococcus sp.]MCM1394910.1 1-deoxy-D-xylulose-5-phosphate synthase [Corallococcus sp.]